MYVLNSFANVAVSSLGKEQFLYLYLCGGNGNLYYYPNLSINFEIKSIQVSFQPWPVMFLKQH